MHHRDEINMKSARRLQCVFTMLQGHNIVLCSDQRPDMFQAVVNDVLKDNVGKHVLVYLNALVVISKTAEE